MVSSAPPRRVSHLKSLGISIEFQLNFIEFQMEIGRRTMVHQHLPKDCAVLRVAEGLQRALLHSFGLLRLGFEVVDRFLVHAQVCEVPGWLLSTSTSLKCNENEEKIRQNEAN